MYKEVENRLAERCQRLLYGRRWSVQECEPCLPPVPFRPAAKPRIAGIYRYEQREMPANRCALADARPATSRRRNENAAQRTRQINDGRTTRNHAQPAYKDATRERADGLARFPERAAVLSSFSPSFVFAMYVVHSSGVPQSRAAKAMFSRCVLVKGIPRSGTEGTQATQCSEGTRYVIMYEPAR